MYYCGTLVSVPWTHQQLIAKSERPDFEGTKIDAAAVHHECSMHSTAAGLCGVLPAAFQRTGGGGGGGRKVVPLSPRSCHDLLVYLGFLYSSSSDESLSPTR